VSAVVVVRPTDHAQLDDPLAKEYPYLVAYLYRGSWDDIQPRDPSSLSIRAANGLVHATLQCPTEGTKTVGRGLTLSEALADLEGQCRTGKGNWSDMKFGTGIQKKNDLRKKMLAAEEATKQNQAKGGKKG
jgi:hypothetical protein